MNLIKKWLNPSTQKQTTTQMESAQSTAWNHESEPESKTPQPKPEKKNILGRDFAELDLPDSLNKAIVSLDFSQCTPVQKEVLPHSLDGEDVIAQAQTGTGKTAAFLIAIITYHLENPEYNNRKAGTPFALIIAPTRELVLQISQDAVLLTKFTDIKVISVVGGIDYEKQKTQLAGPVEIIVATPGRLLDFCRSNIIDLSKVEMLVIDEADRMLNMGFIPDVKAIVQRTPKKDKRQTQLYSATLSEDIKRLANQWTMNPVKVAIEPEKLAVDSIEQIVYFTATEEKLTVLGNLISENPNSKLIVFVNRRDDTRRLEDRLYRRGFNTGLLTGEVPQRKRIKTLTEFKEGKIQVLIATDVAGRGIHVDNISHVVNFNLPEDPEDYIHRIGRTGRAGATGTSISLVCESDAFMMPSIEALLGESLTFQYPPDQLLAPLQPPYRKSRSPSKPAPRRRR